MTPRSVRHAARSGASLCAFFVAWLTASGALACPVCFSPQDEANRWAFIITTGFLTFLPLLLIGAGAYWYVKRVRLLEAGEEQIAADELRLGGRG